jgi:ubiquinone/menaquinone biosynthesis C-methylase UbiE
LEKLERDAHQQGLTNVEIIWGDAEEYQGTRLRDASIDVVVLANTLFQLDNKAAVIEEANRILKIGGKMLIIDWSESFGGMGPKASHVFTQDLAEGLARDYGFTLDSEIETGDHHYGLIFHK